MDSSQSTWTGIRGLRGIPYLVFRAYHPHIDMSQELTLNGSVGPDEYARIFGEIELYAREGPRWNLSTAAECYTIVHACAAARRLLSPRSASSEDHV